MIYRLIAFEEKADKGINIDTIASKNKIKI
jgi:hypothetical protein